MFFVLPKGLGNNIVNKAAIGINVKKDLTISRMSLEICEKSNIPQI